LLYPSGEQRRGATHAFLCPLVASPNVSITEDNKYQRRRNSFELEANSGGRSNGCKLVMKDWKLDGF